MIADTDSEFLGFRLQGMCHGFGSVRPDGCGPASGVMVGLISHILAVSVCRKRKAILHKMHETPGTERSLTQSDVPVHSLAVKQGSGHLHHAVGLIAAER